MILINIAVFFIYYHGFSIIVEYYCDIKVQRRKLELGRNYLLKKNLLLKTDSNIFPIHLPFKIFDLKNKKGFSDMISFRNPP